MGNVFRIARKEFVDLSSSFMVIIVLVVFLAYAFLSIYNFSVQLNGGKPGQGLLYQDHPGIAANFMLCAVLGWFGSMIGIIIGCSTISSELAGNALSSLIVKPVYRDTIINGKMIGSLGFMATILTVFTAISTLGFVILCGNSMWPYLPEYFQGLPFMLVYAMINVTVFLSFAILISLIVRDHAFAMVLSTLTVYISQIMIFPDIASNLNKIIPGLGLDSMIVSLSPRGILTNVQFGLADPSSGAFEAFMNVLPDISKLLTFAVVALILSYIIFIWRDLS